MLNQLICFLALISTVPAEMIGYIVGGTEASIKDWPFITFVATYRDNEPVGACGGSLISSQTVLTAAHCLDDVTDKKKEFDQYTYSILMGHKDFLKATMHRTVKDYKTHEEYNPDGVPHDIGIMFLELPVSFHHNVKKVLLMTRHLGKTMHREGGLLVGGWGRYSEGTKALSTTLKSLEQTLISTPHCRQYMEDDDELLDPGILCAGELNATDYAYSGDSGGPLARLRDQYLAGVVSYRMETHGITIYTSVAYYYQWIEQNQEIMFAQQCGGYVDRTKV